MEYNLKKQKDYQMQVDRKVQRSEIKKKLLLDQQRLHASDESEADELDNKDLLDAKVTRSSAVAAGMDAESSGTSDDEKNAKKSSSTFVNPLAKPKKIIDMDGEMSEGEWSSDNASEGKDDKKKKKD